jgi:hypothetical protein
VVQNRVVRPRVGRVEYAPLRKKRMARLTWIMLVVNVVALVLGSVAFFQGADGGAAMFALVPPVVLLLGFSLAALTLGIPRLFVYGVLLATAGLVGEALWNRGLVSHHGFPVVFGVSSVLILVTGIVRFARFLPPPPDEVGGRSKGGSHE